MGFFLLENAGKRIWSIRGQMSKCNWLRFSFLQYVYVRVYILYVIPFNPQPSLRFDELFHFINEHEN